MTHRSHFRRRLPLAIAVPLLALACWTASGPLRAIPGANWPDPSVHVWNGVYYTFATNTDGFDVPVRHSTGTWSGVPLGWSAPSEAFPWWNQPSWIVSCGGKHMWGPNVVEISGAHYLYFSAAISCNGSGFGEHAIGVAVSYTGPMGPYNKIGDAPLHRDPWGRGAIDPEVFLDDDGTGYLLYSTDWGPLGPRPGVSRTIEGRRMASPWGLESVNTPGAWNVLLTANAGNWEGGVVEAPSMVKHNGTYYLFYSGGIFTNVYQTNFALCGTPLATCGRLTGNPWMFNGWEGMENPGGMDVVRLYVPSSGAWAYAALFHEKEPGRREMMFTVLSPW
jgi:arabinan endo-1,5-alpha-L-arabinosidase